ncbi:MAG: Fic family protein [Oscillospiraceae bacterium]|nr:Fic family protein [Oscillospiraceae bacterium]
MKTNLLALLQEESEMKLKGGLYHQTQIKLAFNSNRIEGCKLSEEQTRYIFETNTIGICENESANVDDIIETVSHFICFDYMLATAHEELSQRHIKEYHRLLKSSTTDSRKKGFNVGEYKSRPNAVGDTRTTSPSKVIGEMTKLLREYNAKASVTFEEIIAFHHKFECIHPFQDGNGRVGRIIMFRECLRNDITPFIVGHEHKMFYYRGLKEWGNERGFLLDTCLSAQDAYQKHVDYFYPQLTD